MNEINLKFDEEQFNEYLGNIIDFNDDDIKIFHDSYHEIVDKGFHISYLSCIFYSIYIGEIIMFGILENDKIRDFLSDAIDSEMSRKKEDVERRFLNLEDGYFGKNETADEQSKIMLMDLISKSLNKIRIFNEWFGTEEGKKEKYNYEEEEIKEIKKIICRFPYLLRRHDFDKDYTEKIIAFGTEIMEHI